MKKLLLTTMLVTALAGCSSAKTSAASASGDHLARIQSAGKITIATEGVWSPFTYHDETTDELVGFDVEVAKAVADKLGVEAEFKDGMLKIVIPKVEETKNKKFIEIE